MVLHNAEEDLFYIWGMFANKALWEEFESTGRLLLIFG